MSKRQHFIKGTVLGMVLGFIAGILLAPKSGKETRDDIKRTTKRFIDDVVEGSNKMQRQIGNRVKELQEVAKDLGGQAREQSQGLIARAELLKQELRKSTKTLAHAGKDAKDATLVDVRRMMDEGSALMDELEDVTKSLVTSAKTKLSQPKSAEAVQRVEELERNGSDEVDQRPQS